MPMVTASNSIFSCAANFLRGRTCIFCGSFKISYTDAFRGYKSLKRYGKHHTVNHSKSFVDKKTKNHINGIEGFWSYAKHILYNYRWVSKYHFPMYLKEIEYRFNHRDENLFKLFLKLYFGYETP
jgi:transposase